MRLSFFVFSLFISINSYGYTPYSCSDWENPKSDTEKLICAQAKAHLCGYDHIAMQEELSAYAPGLTLMQFLSFNSRLTLENRNQCDEALALLRSIGSAEEREPEVNAYISYLSLSMAASYMNLYADTDKDKVVDGGFNACLDLSYGTSSYTGNLLWGLKNSSLKSNVSELVDIGYVLQIMGTQLSSVGEKYNFLDSNSPEEFTGDHMIGVRSLLNEGDVFGYGWHGNTLPNSFCL